MDPGFKWRCSAKIVAYIDLIISVLVILSVIITSAVVLLRGDDKVVKEFVEKVEGKGKFKISSKLYSFCIIFIIACLNMCVHFKSMCGYSGYQLVSLLLCPVFISAPGLASLPQLIWYSVLNIFQSVFCIDKLFV